MKCIRMNCECFQGQLITCAAIVCERVGNNFVTQATLYPAFATPMAARSPAPEYRPILIENRIKQKKVPPAPITQQSKV